jgi:hypothetical protein
MYTSITYQNSQVQSHHLHSPKVDQYYRNHDTPVHSAAIRPSDAECTREGCLWCGSRFVSLHAKTCLLTKTNSIEHGGLELSIFENDVQFVGGIAHNVGQRHSRPSISEERLDSEVGYGDCAHDRADLEL